MSEPYEEILQGVSLKRPAPGLRHELICSRLHERVQSSALHLGTARLLPRRSQVRISNDTAVCPDLALVTVATGKLWLAVEIVSSDDHHADTVLKKDLYETLRLPRLWMIDPRYDNVEIYHGTAYGMTLKGILAGRESLTEKLLPDFQLALADLFAQAG